MDQNSLKIYTRSGDRGETSLYTGERLSKSDPLIEAIGTVDECNSAIGMALCFFTFDTPLNETKEQLTTIQHALFDLGAALATPRTRAAEKKLEATRFDEAGTHLLEKWIDAMEGHLPKLKSFILPGGHPAGASLHLARSICRRAERLVVPLNDLGDVSDAVMIYLNRLSDYLFVVSRFVNSHAKTPETSWEHYHRHPSSSET